MVDVVGVVVVGDSCCCCDAVDATGAVYHKGRTSAEEETLPLLLALCDLHLGGGGLGRSNIRLGGGDIGVIGADGEEGGTAAVAVPPPGVVGAGLVD